MIGRILATISYVVYILVAVAQGAWQVCLAAFRRDPAPLPAVVELPLRCRTDGEIVAMASSITITPGTLVVGTAAGTADTPPTLFVHALFGGTREEILDDLRDMETRLLRVTRGPNHDTEVAR
ncbi:Na+/H+ antiporter subunit E [Mobilicoccus pelagius]|uniref:Na(+)/H(+) antiporter subunit E n=1 Tax=Mobilicoccus pelagius NBRC 104925 TaxID=1089455 RepID=H5USQ2_9MICO|nr:Na+/H+ antiporter subunit E [Mobilicoccus pelagius]GAB48760.1 Na(+)/H(+) antiporter subunit E [Mobilicoccus pelagius NBRC 104925]